MITLLHGDYIEASRNEVMRLKLSAAGREVRTLDGKSLDSGVLIQALESTSLFGGESIVIIEQLFGKLGKQPKKAEQYASVLLRSGDTAEVVLWEEREIPPSIIKLLGTKTNVRLFKLPALIFQFLDSFRPNSGKMLMMQYEKLIVDVSAEVIFSMLAKRVRQLMELLDHVAPVGLAPWQQVRLTSQAKSFTMEQLIGFEKQLLDSEMSVKSGTSAFTTSQHIQYLLTNL